MDMPGFTGYLRATCTLFRLANEICAVVAFPSFIKVPSRQFSKLRFGNFRKHLG